MYKNYWLRRKAIREDALVTYPLIYGFKTPEKHAFVFVDGDAKSEKKWTGDKDFYKMLTETDWVI